MEGATTRTETVLVTGGSGFLASWCLVELLRRGYHVRTTVRDSSREPEVRAMLEPEVEVGDRLSVHVADLTDDAGWENAISGCDYVLHVASPFPPQQPEDPDELIVPAREGTLRVLRTALGAGVKRIVLTSSAVAVANSGNPPTSGEAFTEQDWSDPLNPDLSPYGRSKTIAERSAWDLVNESGDTSRLSVVCPQRDPRPHAQQGSFLFVAGGRAVAGRDAGHTPARVQLRRRARRRGSAACGR